MLRERAIIAVPRSTPATLDSVKSEVIRRQPIQERSQDKVQRILDATAQLADSMPLDSITMAAIGKAAGASFSSIYRFFPSKDAIFEAVAIASLDRLQHRYEAYFAGSIPEDGARIIDDAIDLYVDFASTEPGFRALWIDWPPTQDIARRVNGLNQPAIQLAKSYAIEKLGFQASPQLDLRLAIAATAASEILRFAFKDNDFPRDDVIAELKHWLKAALLMLR